MLGLGQDLALAVYPPNVYVLYMYVKMETSRSHFSMRDLKICDVIVYYHRKLFHHSDFQSDQVKIFRSHVLIIVLKTYFHRHLFLFWAWMGRFIFFEARFFAYLVICFDFLTVLETKTGIGGKFGHALQVKINKKERNFVK